MESINPQSPSDLHFLKNSGYNYSAYFIVFSAGMVHHHIETFRFNFDLGCCDRDSTLSFIHYFSKSVSQA